MTSFEIIDPKNDSIVNKYLKMIGFDLDYPLQYTAKQHRNMQNKVVIDYMIIGEVNINRESLNSPFSTLYDRMVAAAYQDSSLCRELCKHLNSSLDYNSFKEEVIIEEFKTDLPSNQLNPDEEYITLRIRALESKLLDLRGTPYNDAGDYKMPHEYQENHVAVVQHKNKKRG